MKPKHYNPPSLFAEKGEELHIDGEGLISLMAAVLERGAVFRFKARGSSMTPFIRDGDLITVEPITRRRVGTGSIVAFTRPETGQLVVHRVISLSKEAVFIVGDNNCDCPDGWIPRENLVGNIIRIDRGEHRVWLGLGVERYLIAWLSQKKWLTRLRIIVTNMRNRNGDRII